MYEMVQNAYKVTLVGAFVPLVAGIYWKRANTQGALLSIVMGMGTWLPGGDPQLLARIRAFHRAMPPPPTLQPMPTRRHALIRH
jgi:Na+/proline symporter